MLSFCILSNYFSIVFDSLCFFLAIFSSCHSFCTVLLFAYRTTLAALNNTALCRLQINSNSSSFKKLTVGTWNLGDWFSCFASHASWFLVWRVVAPLSRSVKVCVEVWDTSNVSCPLPLARKRFATANPWPERKMRRESLLKVWHELVQSARRNQDKSQE